VSGFRGDAVEGFWRGSGCGAFWVGMVLVSVFPNLGDGGWVACMWSCKAIAVLSLSHLFFCLAYCNMLGI